MSAEVLLDPQPKPGSKWQGDCVGFFDGTKWTPPDGNINANDLVAAIKTFRDKNVFNATHVWVTDLAPNGLGDAQIKKLVSINDVFTIILGLQGKPYPGPFIEECP